MHRQICSIVSNYWLLVAWFHTDREGNCGSEYYVFVTFGPGIRGELNDTYRNAQEREGIITTLLPSGPDELPKAILARNAKVLSSFRRDLARSNLSIKMIEQHTSTLDKFAQSVLLAEDPPRGLLDMSSADVKAYLANAANKAKTTSFKRFVRFLDATGRMEYEQITSLQKVLKRVPD